MKKKLRYSLDIDQDKCTGCQACVLACSYHHSKVFSVTGKSSIEIFRDNKSGDIKIGVDQSSCDMCPDEEVPLCMQFCAIEAIKFIRKKEIV
ncbi:MAG TPA: hypothetical protein ENG48_09935 [Candidatus Atribacteria bacterium]|nr:MAG: hypothetical protein DRH33_07680 [Candidatus Nealsonbacteria bacterium]HDK27386.1 hypothetical protein [Candidatus Atribacteria bacterium]